MGNSVKVEDTQIKENQASNIEPKKKGKTKSKLSKNRVLKMKSKEDSSSCDSEDDFISSNMKKKCKTDKVSADGYSISNKKLSNCNKQNCCKVCRQRLNYADLKYFPGPSENSIEEIIVLTDPSLSLFTGNEECMSELDQRPIMKLTHYCIYDEFGHFCKLDVGAIEANHHLFAFGYIKPVWNEDNEIDGGIATKEIGPIKEWFISDTGIGEKSIIGLATPYADYYLMAASKLYEPIMNELEDKIFLSKTIIELLVEDNIIEYEDLLTKLQNSFMPNGYRVSEDSLLRYAEFVCDRVYHFDAAGLEEEQKLILSPCIRTLIKLSGITLGKKRATRKLENRRLPKGTNLTKATTTQLVCNVFKGLFKDHMLEKEEEEEKFGNCGMCEECKLTDCGKCNLCLNMVKFGGSGSMKQTCALRKCPNRAVKVANDNDELDPCIETKISNRDFGIKKIAKHNARNIQWEGSIIKEEDCLKFYSAAIVNGDIRVFAGGHVTILPDNPSIPVYIAQVISLWEDCQNREKFLHARWFCRGTETVLGETCEDSRELFITDDCEDINLSAVGKVVNVHCKNILNIVNWKAEGGLDYDGKKNDFSENSFWYRFQYYDNSGRFEDPFISKNIVDNIKGCQCCHRLDALQKKEFVKMGKKKNHSSFDSVTWHEMLITVGDSVFLEPGAYSLREAGRISKRANIHADVNVLEEDYNEEYFPERYRKKENIIGSNNDTPDPFCIGYVIGIIYSGIIHSKLVASEVFLKVKRIYRPSETHLCHEACIQCDWNFVYWSDDVYILELSKVIDKCVLFCSTAIEEALEEFVEKGPNRIYFNNAYNSIKREFEPPPVEAQKIGVNRKEDNSTPIHLMYPTYPKIDPLKALDIFAGCGGLSKGLHQSGVAKTKWSIECDPTAAKAFRLNNPDAVVFNDDCNKILKMVIEGKIEYDGKKLPKKDEVELICGGPPCQGFSGMNRFNYRQHSSFQNSLIVSYLSYCDYYRPRFVILENVRNFVSFNKSRVLKVTMRCLVKMGYQCSFGVLQSGNYGISQTRRRTFIFGAAPGEHLPLYPEPTHVFSRKGCQLSVTVDRKKFNTNCRWLLSAPYRTVTVHDTISDLPGIINGAEENEISYGSESQSHFQRLVRGTNSLQSSALLDHICKDMAPLVISRIALIPTTPGSDWRDLPNIEICLNDGEKTVKLCYTYEDKNGLSLNGARRGVCSCAEGRPCDPSDKQHNTLIPWCLPHTGNRHNHWAGLYGRLQWDGFFSTTITNPEPLGKQGRVLHPDQHRVVSVRECARSQGFPDSFRFYGNIMDKHRQVGNAVPPPLARAIGFEIRKCVYDSEENSKVYCKKNY